VEGLRACCLVKSVVEDRLWPYIKTKIPKPIQVGFRNSTFFSFGSVLFLELRGRKH
jgi:hypothetical protein